MYANDRINECMKEGLKKLGKIEVLPVLACCTDWA